MELKDVGKGIPVLLHRGVRAGANRGSRGTGGKSRNGMEWF